MPDDPAPMASNQANVIDISHWQAGFNFGAFAEAGGLAVICKATEGTSYKDKDYPTFREQAAKAGLGFASYHFFRPGDPTAQANYYLAYAKPDQGERVVIDWEDDATTLANAVKFLQVIQAARPDLQLTVYSGHTCKTQLGSTRDQWLADNTSLWLAQYTTGSPSWPSATWPQWSLWQYSEKGRVAGFAGDVDLDRFNGSDENLLKWIGPVGAPPPPIDEMPTVEIVTRGQVRVVVNGELIT